VLKKQTLFISILCIAILVSGLFVLAKQPLDSDAKFTAESFKAWMNDQTNQCNGTALCITEKVKHVIDGDTIQLESGNRIRISLTNTPEIYQNGYNEATKFTENLCPVGSIVMVDQDDMQPYDKFNRLMGKVVCGDKILNAELLYSAHANILTQYCATSEFANEQWATEYGC